jgi:hypothetical protein
MTSRFASLSRDELAHLVPELLLIGQLIDRSGMAWCIQAFGREQMAEIAIEEWASSSPVYTRRMQRALGYAPEAAGEGDVPTIFKGLQLDIGAPPQFMDFRYTVEDRFNGRFHLAHCGALMDVEPLGPDYVRSMCHDIEDPTFDATAVATNPRAQVRPVHRPPRTPADRTPHCEWTVRISPDHEPVRPHPGMAAVAASAAALLDLDAIDASDEGAADYAGPLVDDLDFAAFSHSALVRIADEVCLQMHLLVLAFRAAVLRRSDAEREREITTRQLIGIAGVAAARLHSVVEVRGTSRETSEVALGVLALHPLLNPAAYVDADIQTDALHVRRSPAHDDGAWLDLVGPHEVRPLQAIVRAIDPHLDVEVSGDATEWTAHVVRREEPARDADEVAVTRFSSGAAWEFEGRTSLPIWPV